MAYNKLMYVVRTWPSSDYDCPYLFGPFSTRENAALWLHLNKIAGSVIPLNSQNMRPGDVDSLGETVTP